MHAGKNILLTSNLPNVTNPSLYTSLSRIEILSIISLVKNWLHGVLAGIGTLLNKLSR
jgi:hypothetical protein